MDLQLRNKVPKRRVEAKLRVDRTKATHSNGNPPFSTGLRSRIHAAIFSFCAGVMPPMPILGRSLL